LSQNHCRQRIGILRKEKNSEQTVDDETQTRIRSHTRGDFASLIDQLVEGNREIVRVRAVQISRGSVSEGQCPRIRTDHVGSRAIRAVVRPIRQIRTGVDPVRIGRGEDRVAVSGKLAQRVQKRVGGTTGITAINNRDALSSGSDGIDGLNRKIMRMLKPTLAPKE
jgi:hypothetical protein